MKTVCTRHFQTNWETSVQHWAGLGGLKCVILTWSCIQAWLHVYEMPRNYMSKNPVLGIFTGHWPEDCLHTAGQREESRKKHYKKMLQRSKRREVSKQADLNCAPTLSTGRRSPGSDELQWFVCRLRLLHSFRWRSASFRSKYFCRLTSVFISRKMPVHTECCRTCQILMMMMMMKGRLIIYKPNF